MVVVGGAVEGAVVEGAVVEGGVVVVEVDCRHDDLRPLPGSRLRPLVSPKRRPQRSPVLLPRLPDESVAQRSDLTRSDHFFAAGSASSLRNPSGVTENVKRSEAGRRLG